MKLTPANDNTLYDLYEQSWLATDGEPDLKVVAAQFAELHISPTGKPYTVEQIEDHARRMGWTTRAVRTRAHIDAAVAKALEAHSHKDDGVRDAMRATVKATMSAAQTMIQYAAMGLANIMDQIRTAKENGEVEVYTNLLPKDPQEAVQLLWRSEGIFRQSATFAQALESASEDEAVSLAPALDAIQMQLGRLTASDLAAILSDLGAPSQDAALINPVNDHDLEDPYGIPDPTSSIDDEDGDSDDASGWSDITDVLTSS